ncbi:MAG TPA: ribosome biogenesis GTPase Der [Gemmatimonadaceae bacterium]|nr:ribosome biogenesis GTPase Der [Gemmatimonadaceae bacterium]
MSTPVVALVGRPNVGKSMLFNRIVGHDTAIVSEEAGTTRDRHFARAEWQGRDFFLVDTGGIMEDTRAPIDAAIRHQVQQAIDEADLLLLVVDGKGGLHPIDHRVAEIIRDAGKPFIVVVNKVDDPSDPAWYEFFELGAGDPMPVSAMNGKQSGDLLDAVVSRIPEVEAEQPDALRVAVIGRPNVGKSSFVNRLLGEERLVVAAEAGTTRDAIDAMMKYHGREVVFVDTAGLRRQSRIDDGVEFYSALRTRRAIERADLCCLMVDATEGLHNQDLKIAALAWESGRGLIVIVNKWDLYEKNDKSAPHFEKECREKAPFLAFVPFLFTSAKTGLRVTKALDVILEVAAERTKRITTSEVNERLGELIARQQPAQAAGRDVRLMYATQVDVAPPTFAVFGNHPDLVQEHYVRYLHNGFRESWGFKGNPVRIVLRRKAA